MSNSQRYRTDSMPASKFPYYHREVYQDGRLLSRGSSSAYTGHRNKWMEDRVTSSYNSRRAAGDIIMNPCHFYEMEYDDDAIVTSQYTHRVYSQNWDRWTTTDYFYRTKFQAASPYLESPHNLRDLCIQGGIAKAQSSVSQILVTFAELEKTIDLIIGAKKRLARRFIDLFAAKRTKVQRLDAMGNSWLEARYGWRPLIGDVQSLAEAAASLVTNVPYIRTQYTVKSGQLSQTRTRNLNNTVESLKITDKISGEHTYKFVSIARPNPEILSQIDKAFGLTNLASTAWELVPFSFVVDWFLNIGDTIKQYEGKDLVSFSGSCLTHTYEGTCTSTSKGVSTTSTLREVKRDTGVHTPIPSPTFKFNLSWDQYLDLAFLGRQIFKSR